MTLKAIIGSRSMTVGFLQIFSVQLNFLVVREFFSSIPLRVFLRCVCILVGWCHGLSHDLSKKTSRTGAKETAAVKSYRDVLEEAV